MPTLQRLSGVQIQGRVEAAGMTPSDRVHAVADNRTFVVGHEAHRLLTKAGVQVPPPGQTYDMAKLNQTLMDGGLTPEERIRCKTALISCGLLRG